MLITDSSRPTTYDTRLMIRRTRLQGVAALLRAS